MPRKPNKPKETPMDIVAGNIAGLMQRQKVTLCEMGRMLGYADERSMKARMANTTLFTGADLNHICHYFGVTLEQLSHDVAS